MIKEKIIEFGICFEFDCEDESPTVLIAARDGTQYVEIFEEPILKSKVWSGDYKDWDAGLIAKQLLDFMNSSAYNHTE